MVELSTLLSRCQAGDELAWEAFVRRFQGRIYGMACAYTGHTDDARELAQDVFVRLYETRRRWPDAERFMPWMVLTSRHLCVDYLRRRKARTKAGEVELDQAAMLLGSEPDPEEQAGSSGRKSMVWAAIRRLTAISRDMIILRDVQGLSIAEVASSLRIPIGTVKSRASRARVELAEHVLALSQPVPRGDASLRESDTAGSG
jgi:RNA polymerase sigma-70 factor (ECF subfamily)